MNNSLLYIVVIFLAWCIATGLLPMILDPNIGSEAKKEFHIP